MAVWDAEVWMSSPLDFRLVRNSFVTKFWNPAILVDATSWLAERGYDIVTLEASGWRDADDMHSALAAALAFPDYYGRNLAALNDCLSDVADGNYGVSVDATGLVLVLNRFDAYAAIERDTAQGLLDIVADQARNAMLIGRRILCLLQSNDPDLYFEPVGSTPVPWNQDEWLDTKRGV